MKYFLKNYDVADPRFGNFILYLVFNTSDFVDEVEKKLAELRPSCLDKSTIIKHNEEMFITFMTRNDRREFWDEFVKRDYDAFVEPYYLEFSNNKDDMNKSSCDVRPIDANYFVKTLKGMYKRAGWNDRDIHMSLWDVMSNLDNVPTLENFEPEELEIFKNNKYMPYRVTVDDALVWTPVKERLPILTDDEDNEFLVTMRTVQSTINKPLYWVCMAKYSENLNELSKDDFPEDKHSGWYNYDAEGGYFYNMEFAVGNLKREVVAWMPLPKAYEENK